jgi:hypothetical protein
MPYCSHCGLQLPDGGSACPQCAMTRPRSIAVTAVPDQPNRGVSVLAFFIPVVGLALWYAWRQQTPLRARSARRAAVTGLVVGAVAYVVAFAVYLTLIATLLKKIS